MAGDFELEISYLVTGASWHPQHDVRVQIADDHSQGNVHLTSGGVVPPPTGGGWDNLGLSLSTARPSLAAIPPELEPWYLNVYTPAPPIPLYAAPARAGGPLRAAKVMMPQQAMMPVGGIAMDENAEFSMAQQSEPMSVAANVATATVEQTGTALIFRVGRSVDIPSDGSPHKTTIARDNLPCTFDYVSAPVIEENVHLRANISNTTERVLLSGDASIFLSGEYVGTTKVKTTAPAEKFKIFLGIDDGIKVKRELIERSVDKGSPLQGNMRRISYAYRLTVHNYAAAPMQVVIRDHLPVSQHERVKVKVQSIRPPPTNSTRLELMVWQFTLAAGAEQKIEYRFVVEHPQDVKVIGLP